MRFTIHYFPTPTGGRIVLGTLSTAEASEHRLSDRQANGEAFPGETRVRLPRSLTRKLGHRNPHAAVAALLGRHYV